MKEIKEIENKGGVKRGGGEGGGGIQKQLKPGNFDQLIRNRFLLLINQLINRKLITLIFLSTSIHLFFFFLQV